MQDPLKTPEDYLEKDFVDKKQQRITKYKRKAEEIAQHTTGHNHPPSQSCTTDCPAQGQQQKKQKQ